MKLKINLASWKTTLSGIASFAFGFVAFSPALFAKWPWVIEISKYAMLGGLALLGLTAKDSNVTGGGPGATVAPGSVPDATLHATLPETK